MSQLYTVQNLGYPIPVPPVSYPVDAMRTGMAYVPVQAWEGVYEPFQALERGTLFPSLDLPFSGRMGRN